MHTITITLTIIVVLIIRAAAEAVVVVVDIKVVAVAMATKAAVVQINSSSSNRTTITINKTTTSNLLAVTAVAPLARPIPNRELAISIGPRWLVGANRAVLLKALVHTSTTDIDYLQTMQQRLEGNVYRAQVALLVKISIPFSTQQQIMMLSSMTTNTQQLILISMLFMMTKNTTNQQLYLLLISQATSFPQLCYSRNL